MYYVLKDGLKGILLKTRSIIIGQFAERGRCFVMIEDLKNGEVKIYTTLCIVFCF